MARRDDLARLEHGGRRNVVCVCSHIPHSAKCSTVESPRARKAKKNPHMGLTGRGRDRQTAAAAAADSSETEIVSSSETGGTDDVSRFIAQRAAAEEAVRPKQAPAAGSAVVTILAASKLPVAEGVWVACCGGSSATTGTPTHYLEAAAKSTDAPRGSPSWSGEPLTLALSDITSDLILLLCETTSTGSKRCVGRIVLPLTEFLLPLNPFGAQQAPTQLWAALFPPAAACAPPGAIDSYLTHAVSGVDGAGLPPPRHGQQGAALVRIELVSHVSLLSAYTLISPFPASAAVALDAATGREAVPAERLLLAVSRLHSTVSGLPALIVLTATRPWSAGFAILFLTAWLCFATSPAGLPWWLLAAWMSNGVAIRLLSAAPSPWESAADAASAATAATATAGSTAEKLARLEGALLPLVRRLEAAAALAERTITAAAFFDPRASTLLCVPLLTGALVASFALTCLSAVVTLFGGGAVFTFLAVAALLVLNALTFHRNEVYSWLGARGEGGADGDGPLLPGGGGSSSSSSAAAVRFANEQRDLALTEVLSRTSHASDVLAAMTANLVSRVPDAPTAASRMIARAATRQQEDEHEDGPPAAKDTAVEEYDH